MTDEEATIYSPATSIDNEKHESLKTSSTVHPPDRGLHAWLFLAGSFLIEGLALGKLPLRRKRARATDMFCVSLSTGFPGAYGVFQDYYSTHPPFQNDSSLPTVSTCAMVCKIR